MNYIPSTKMFPNFHNINICLPEPQHVSVNNFGMTRLKIVQSRINYAKMRISVDDYSVLKYLFTFSSKYGVIGSFAFILKKVICPKNTLFYQLSLESVRRGPELEILSFMTTGPILKDSKSGDPMFLVVLKEILTIFSELRFTPDIFLKIARAIVPPEYVVVMHNEPDQEIAQQLFNPFSIPVDYFSVQTRPEKRQRSCVPRIEQFSKELAVEVVEEEKNEKPSKRQRN